LQIQKKESNLCGLILSILKIEKSILKIEKSINNQIKMRHIGTNNASQWGFATKVWTYQVGILAQYAGHAGAGSSTFWIPDGVSIVSPGNNERLLPHLTWYNNRLYIVLVVCNLNNVHTNVRGWLDFVF
jgi:hypothetical protein